MLRFLSQVLSNRVKTWQKLLGEAHLLYCVKRKRERVVELKLSLEPEHAILPLFALVQCAPCRSRFRGWFEYSTVGVHTGGTARPCL